MAQEWIAVVILVVLVVVVVVVVVAVVVVLAGIHHNDVVAKDSFERLNVISGRLHRWGAADAQCSARSSFHADGAPQAKTKSQNPKLQDTVIRSKIQACMRMKTLMLMMAVVDNMRMKRPPGSTNIPNTSTTTSTTTTHHSPPAKSHSQRAQANRCRSDGIHRARSFGRGRRVARRGGGAGPADLFSWIHTQIFSWIHTQILDPAWTQHGPIMDPAWTEQPHPSMDPAWTQHGPSMDRTAHPSMYPSSYSSYSS